MDWLIKSSRSPRSHAPRGNAVAARRAANQISEIAEKFIARFCFCIVLMCRAARSNCIPTRRVGTRDWGALC
jgi:hypothetical protein